MKCTVQRVAKNLRYRMLTINGEKYLLDMGGASLWKILFPFFYWFFPNRIYKAENKQTVEELTAPTVKQKTGSPQYGWIAVASIVLGNLLSPLAGYFDISSPVRVNVTIITVIVVLEILLIFFLNQMFKTNMYQVIDLQQTSKGQIWIMPSFKSLFLFICNYILFWGFSIMGIASYIEDGNWTILLITTVMLFVALTMPGLLIIIEGNTRIKFLGGKRSKVFPQKKA